MITTDNEALYLAKLHTYTVDPAFGPTVLAYLRTNAEEFRKAQDAASVAGDYARAAEYAAKAEAYRDAVRVLQDADDAAGRWAEQHAVALPPVDPFTFDVGV